jgi:hypothetical protein
MQRILPWLALICATAIAVVAVIELNDRADDDRLALEPTALPSPSIEPEASPSPETSEPGASPERTARKTPRETATRTRAAPAPETEEEQTAEPEPTPTPEPPRTPTPEPVVSAGPIDTSRARTPRTGGGAVANGLLVLAAALALRATNARVRRGTRPTKSTEAGGR